MRATDLGGNNSAWTTARCTARPLDDRALSASTGWTSGTATADYLGTYRQTAAAGKELSRTCIRLTACSSTQLLAATCGTCCSVTAYWNCVWVQTISLKSVTSRSRVLLPIKTFATASSGTLRLRVSTTNLRVRLDGLAVRRG